MGDDGGWLGFRERAALGWLGRAALGWLGRGALLGLALTACGVESDSADEASPRPAGDFANKSDNAGTNQQGGGASGSPPTESPPAEEKVEKSFEAPIATKSYIWSANPESGRVALISAESFKVDTIQTGETPRYLAAVPGPVDKVVVINAGSHEAAVVTATTAGITQRRYAIHDDANALAVSDDGRWAIAWSDVSRYATELGDGKKPTDVDSRLGFQQTTWIDLSAATEGSGAVVAPRLAVGYRPSSIVFVPTRQEACVVTTDGITVVDLKDPTSPAFSRNIAYSSQTTTPNDKQADGGTGEDAATDSATGPNADDASDSDAGSAPKEDADARPPEGDSQAPNQQVEAAVPNGSDASRNVSPSPSTSSGTPDVSITRDGSYAIVRREGSDTLDVVDLVSATHTAVRLSGPVTDISLAPDGTFALAVVRDTAEVAVLPIPGIATSSTGYRSYVLSGETIGRGIVTAASKSALLFTTAYHIGRLVVLALDGTASKRVVNLNAPIQAVFPTSDAAHAVVLHTSSTSSDVAGAFSIVPLSVERSPFIVATTAPPKQVALTEDGRVAVINTSDEKAKRYVTYVARMPELVYDDYSLASAPVSAGIVSTFGYVAQQHPEGRVTFLDLGNTPKAPRTITGFELGASIVEWPARDGGQQ